MASNWGFGIGNFASGFAQGLRTGDSLNTMIRDGEAEEVRRAELDRANKERNATVSAETNRLMGIGEYGPPESAAGPAAPPVQQPAGPVSASLAAQPPQQPADPEPSQVERPAAPAPLAAGGLPQMGEPQKPAMTREQAQASAEKSVPSVMEFFQKKGVPKIAETYLAQGNPDKAQAWTTWAENADNQRNMKKWAKAWRSAQTGDMEGAADAFFDLYKGYDDGVTPLSKDVVKDKDGNLTGFNVKLKVDATGEERSAFIDRNQLLDFGLSALSPPQMFEAVWKRQQASDKAKADAAAKAGEIRMQATKEIAVENARQGGRIALEDREHGNAMLRIDRKGEVDGKNQRNKVQQELDATVDVLRKNGYSEEFIRDALPGILKIDNYKKGASPEEAKRLAFSDRMKNDPSFARMPADKQRSIIEQDMNLIFGGVKPNQTGGSGKPAAPANPAARGLPVLDTRTGQVVYR